MKIKELQSNQGKVDVTVEVVSKDSIRTFSKFGKDGRVCNAIVKDDSGQVKLTLWNDEVDAINVGDIVQITNGYVKEWQGELQLSAGKFGKMEVTGKVAGDVKAPAPPAPEEHEDRPMDDEEYI
ncbi:DNA-binding protein [Candidatus Woesearchaeota archaeon]|nr:DNA-binding protein [Candidatus Woesearchaeota archaeon]